jgi:hypothetical protein
MCSDREILATRTASSMVSVWTEYLCLAPGRVEICQYEVLDEVKIGDDGEPLPFPETINDKAVFGVDNGYIIGGSLQTWSEDDAFIYTANSIEDALSWIEERGFVGIPDLREKISGMVDGEVDGHEQLDLPENVQNQIHRILSSPSLYPIGFDGTTNRRLRYERAWGAFESYYRAHGSLPQKTIEIDGVQFDFT